MRNNPAKLAAISIVVVLLGGLIAWAGSQNGITVGGWPLFGIAVAAAFIIQWIAFIPAALNRTERFFDLTGSLTYISISVLLIVMRPEFSATALLLGLMVIIWAIRLGTFLFRRVRKDGADGRFDDIKGQPLRFFNVWTIQGLWVTFTAAAAWIAMSSAKPPQFNALFVVGLAIWAVGFTVELVADLQKSRFRSDPQNKNKFISTGLWSWSQHPNYFGEITLWLGVALAAISSLQGWQLVGLLSPVFVIILLTQVSGIPLLQRRAEQRWGEDPDFQHYRRTTSLLIPLPPSK